MLVETREEKKRNRLHSDLAEMKTEFVRVALMLTSRD